MLIDYHTNEYIEYTPRDFKKGEIVTSIVQKEHYLELGKKYEVILYKKGNIYVKNYVKVKTLYNSNDRVGSQWWDDDYFQSISNIRNEKIEKILN